MAEETYVRPNKLTLEKKLQARAKQARVKARAQETPRRRAEKARKSRQVRAARLSSQLLPDGLTPALRAKLSAAHRRAESDPDKVALLERAALAKRVQLAKREAGIPGADKPMKFMGMDPKEHEQAVTECELPPAMTTFRKEAPKKKAKKVSKAK